MFQGAETCDSTDPTAEVTITANGDATACTDYITVDWGDGDTETYTVQGGEANVPVVVGSHTYAQTGSYTIAKTGYSANCGGEFYPTDDTFTLDGYDPTATAVACSPTSIPTAGQTTCTATLTDTQSTVNAPTGQVSFASDPATAGTFEYDDGPDCTLGTGSTGPASCSVSFDAGGSPGPFTMTASYSGDTYDQPSSGTSPAVSVVLTTSTGIECSPDPLEVDAETACTATVTNNDGISAPAGEVSFSAAPDKGAFTPAADCTLGANTLLDGESDCSAQFTPTQTGRITISGVYYPGVGQPANSEDSDALSVTCKLEAGSSKCASVGSGGSPRTAIPVARSVPRVSGHARVGAKLHCVSGKWSKKPTKVTYRWVAEGRPVPGAATRLVRLRKVEEGLKLSCVATPYEGSKAGKPVTSRSVQVAVPVVSGCPAASRTLGSVVRLLGLQRSSVGERLAASSDSGQLLEDEFCLTPAGLLVGYPPDSLLGSLSGGARRRFAGRVVWVSTANRFYSIAGVGPGTSLSSAKRLLKLTGPYRLGGQAWYLARHGKNVVVLIVRGGVVWQLGVSDWPLRTGKAAARGLLKGLGRIYRQSTQISGPLRALDGYWLAIGKHAFSRATGYVRPGVLGSGAAFVASERREGVHSAQFEGRVLSQSATQARVRIVRLITHDHRYGCRTWHGTYRLARSPAGRWQIARAAITPRSCT